MNTIKKVAKSTKEFVGAHKTGLAFIAGGAIAIAVTKPALKSHDNFLKDHDLFDEYYKISQ